MLNPIECFLEIVHIQEEAQMLVIEVQQFLDFDVSTILQQDQRKIVQDPLLLVNWFNCIEDKIISDQSDNSLKPLIQVQVLLINKFVQISNQNLLQEYFYLFEILQKKNLFLFLQQQQDEIFNQSIEISKQFYKTIDQNKLSTFSILLYNINLFHQNQKIDEFYQFLSQFDNKKPKLVEQQSNLLLYGKSILLQICCDQVEQNQNIENSLNICLQLREELKKYNSNYLMQCNQCILLCYYKLKEIENFLQFSKQFEQQKVVPIEIQILILIVKLQELINESDFDKIKIQLSKLMNNLMENNLTLGSQEILLIVQELIGNIHLYPQALLVIYSWLQFKYNLLLKTSNQQNLQKIIKEIFQLIEDCPTLLNLNRYKQDELQYLASIILNTLIELTQIIFTIYSNFEKLTQNSIDEYLGYILNTIPYFISDNNLTKQFGQLISLVSTSQIKKTEILQHLAMYLNLQFGKLPQAQNQLFQSLLKNYSTGFTTAVLLFLHEFLNNHKQENRLGLCKQLKSLLEESSKIFDKNQVPFYCILEACLKIDQTYHIETLVNFFEENALILNQQLYHFLLDLIAKVNKSNLSCNMETICFSLHNYISQKNQLNSDLIKYTYTISNLQPQTLNKRLLRLYAFFMLNSNLQICNVQFIKETVMGNNQYKYQWKIEDNKTLFVMISDILEQASTTLDTITLKNLFDILFYLIGQNTKEEINKIIPYVLRQIIKIAYQNKLDENVLKILQISTQFDQLFSLLLVELQAQGGPRILGLMKKLIYEHQIPIQVYLLVITQIIEMSDTLDTVLEMIPQLNQILRTSTIDENLKPYTQLLFLKLSALKEYIPINRMDMICQAISLLQI